MGITKQQAAYARGKALEKFVYDKINLFLQLHNKGSEEDNYRNIIIPRPKIYETRKWHKKSKCEIDNMFYFKGTLYIIQCKFRKGVSRTGRTNCFFVNPKKGKEIWLDGKKQTGKYLHNLWHAKTYIKFTNYYAYFGKPKIRTILLLDSMLRIGDRRGYNTSIRGTSVITKEYFTTFLKEISPKTTENGV